MPLRSLHQIPAILEGFADPGAGTVTVGRMLLPWFSHYVRVLFPATTADGTTLRWGALAPGRITAQSQWWDVEQLGTPSDTRWEGITPPPMGSMDAATATALSALLSGHTSSAGECYFLLWEGSAGLRPELVDGASVLVAPNERRMRVLAGTLGDATESTMAGSPHRPLWWIAADGSWCVGNDLSGRSVFIGGDLALVRAIMNSGTVESFVVDPRQTVYSEDC